MANASQIFIQVTDAPIFARIILTVKTVAIAQLKAREARENLHSIISIYLVQSCQYLR